jgi:hypothetical protein
LTVRRGFLEDRKYDYGIVEEEQEACWDREMRGGISETQKYVEDSTDTEGP